MAKRNGSTRASSSESPSGLKSEQNRIYGNANVQSAIAGGSNSVDRIVAMRGENQPDINTEARWRLEDMYDAQYRIKENIAPTQRYAAYETALDRGDHNDVLKVLEDRGDRVLVASLVYGMDLPLHPTEVVRKADIVFFRTATRAQDYNKRR